MKRKNKALLLLVMASVSAISAGAQQTIDNAKIGQMLNYGSGWAGFCHSALTNPDRYALLQKNDGSITLINKAVGTGYIAFRVGNADKMIMMDNGYFGIGKVPSTALDVAGTATTVNMQVNNQLQVNGQTNLTSLFAGTGTMNNLQVNGKTIMDGSYTSQNGLTLRESYSNGNVFDVNIQNNMYTLNITGHPSRTQGITLSLPNGGVQATYDQSRYMVPQYGNWGTYYGDGGAAIVNDNGNYKSLMIVGNYTANGSTRVVKVWDVLDVQGTLKINGIPVSTSNNNITSPFTVTSAGLSSEVCQVNGGTAIHWVYSDVNKKLSLKWYPNAALSSNEDIFWIDGLNTTDNRVLRFKNGTIKAKELQVCVNGTCDYVFADDYKLMPLNDLQHYVQNHKHLPEVESEAELKAKGNQISVGDYNIILLKKVEELTLYMLEQNSTTSKLKAENELLKKDLSTLAAKIDKIQIR